MLMMCYSLGNLRRLSIVSLKKDFDLNIESTVESFVGVEVIEHKDGVLARQSDLMKQIIVVVGVEKANSCKTPASTVGLGADVGGAPRKESWANGRF